MVIETAALLEALKYLKPLIHDDVTIQTSDNSLIFSAGTFAFAEVRLPVEHSEVFQVAFPFADLFRWVSSASETLTLTVTDMQAEFVSKKSKLKLSGLRPRSITLLNPPKGMKKLNFTKRQAAILQRFALNKGAHAAAIIHKGSAYTFNNIAVATVAAPALPADCYFHRDAFRLFEDGAIVGIGDAGVFARTGRDRLTQYPALEHGVLWTETRKMLARLRQLAPGPLGFDIDASVLHDAIKHHRNVDARQLVTLLPMDGGLAISIEGPKVAVTHELEATLFGDWSEPQALSMNILCLLLPGAENRLRVTWSDNTDEAQANPYQLSLDGALVYAPRWRG